MTTATSVRRNWKRTVNNDHCIAYFNTGNCLIHATAFLQETGGWRLESHLGNLHFPLVGTKTHSLGFFSTKSQAQRALRKWMKENPDGCEYH